MPIRGIRGAVQADANSSDAIRSSTRRLLEEIVRANDLNPADIAAAFFTVSDDLNAAFPAAGARDLGWTQVPMLCHREIPVPDAPPRIVRVLLLINTRIAAAAVHHIYLGAAQCLRPDLAESAPGKSKRRSGTQQLRARLFGKSLSPGQESTTSSEAEQP
jgi:chorismate mutase